jgi:hypothetical protein
MVGGALAKGIAPKVKKKSKPKINIRPKVTTGGAVV